MNTPSQPSKRNNFLAPCLQSRSPLPPLPLLVPLTLCPVDQVARLMPRKGPTAQGQWTGSMPLSLCLVSHTVGGVSVAHQKFNH